MKKIFIIAIIFSLAWSQTCPYDGSGIRYRTGETKSSRDGYISYEWICEGNTVGSNRHKIWSEEKIQSPTGADNSYQQQPQQPQQQQVLPDYSPVIEAMKDKRTDEQKRKDAEDLEKKRKEYDDYWSNASCGELIVGGALMYWIISMLVEMWGDDQEPVSVYDFDEDDGIY
tara:strand:+ start:276 stop:788 length:513 start_codon:yes stop_codon:yes gene_type:complete